MWQTLIRALLTDCGPRY